MFFSIATLAISLSLDALGVGLAYGLKQIRIPLISKLVICIFSIIYSGASLIAGSLLSNILPPYLSKLIGVSILSLMGVWMLVQAFIKREDSKPGSEASCNEHTLFKIAIKSLGITIQVIKNPIEGDIDKSGSIDMGESLLLGLALSVDAIGVGIGSALAGFHSAVIPPAVGIFQLLFLYAGTFLGSRFSLTPRVNKKIISVLPGVLLIFLAIMRI